MFATFFISILSKKNKKTPNHFQGSSPSTRNRRVVCKDHCLSFLRPWFCWSYCNPAHAGQRKDLSQGLAAKAPYFRPTTVVEVSVPKLMWKGVEHIYIYIYQHKLQRKRLHDMHIFSISIIYTTPTNMYWVISSSQRSKCILHILLW